MNTTTAPTTTSTFTCAPEHRTGSKPYIVPLAGNNDRDIPIFLIYHGREYIDADGNVTRRPVRFEGYAAADAARVLHEQAVA